MEVEGLQNAVLPAEGLVELGADDDEAVVVDGRTFGSEVDAVFAGVKVGLAKEMGFGGIALGGERAVLALVP